MWKGVTAVNTLKDDLTFIVSVSLRIYDIFSQTHTRFKKFQEYPRFCEHLGYS